MSLRKQQEEQSVSTKFNVGDIVVLKSGGPDMTVEEWEVYSGESGEYRCQWFGGRKLEHGSFPPDSLELAPKDDD